MKPIKFAEANKNLLKPSSMTDAECRSLWVYTDGRECVSCWKLTWAQRIKALLFGRIWLSVAKRKRQVETAEVTLEALREKLERENGCSKCNAVIYTDEPFKFRILDDKYVKVNFHFCPECGRGLTIKEE